MSVKFYAGQKDYIPKLNEMDQAFQDAMNVLKGSDKDPLPLGVANPGVAGIYAREDHVHPANIPLTAGSHLIGEEYNGTAAITWSVDATPLNTAGKIVVRDEFGNFSAGTVSAEEFNGPIGQTTPSAGSFTTVDVSGRLLAGTSDYVQEVGWRSLDASFKWDGVAVKFYWLKVARLSVTQPSGFVAEIVVKDDFNYPAMATYRLAVTAHSDVLAPKNSINVHFVPCAPSDYFAFVHVAVDIDGYVWIQTRAEWARFTAFNVLTQRDVEFFDPATYATAETIPTTHRVINSGEYQRIDWNSPTLDLFSAGKTPVSDEFGNWCIWGTGSGFNEHVRAMQVGEHTTLCGRVDGVPDTYLTSNLTYKDDYWRFVSAGYRGVMYNQGLDGHYWLITTNTASYPAEPASFIMGMTLKSTGNLLVGVESGSCHVFHKSLPSFSSVAAVNSDGGDVAVFTGGPTISAVSIASEAALFVGKSTFTDRGIATTGTVNASGTDYAEYMTKADGCGVIAKGAIVGVNADGELTDKWSASVSFVIKSTNPSYVGGDTWGNVDALGMSRPVEPQRKAEVTEQRIVSEAVPEVRDEEGNVTQEAKEAIYETVILEAGDTDEEWQAKQDTYQAELAVFNAALEAARQKVDRIAFCGQAPVNVTGATPGQYVVPVEGPDDTITAILVNDADITFEQYRRCVGIVQNILPDGRANVRVKVC